MSEIKREKHRPRTRFLLAFELLLLLGLFFALAYQGTASGLPTEDEPRIANNLVVNPSFEPPASIKKCDRGLAPEGWICAGWQGELATLLWDETGGSSGHPADTHSVLIFGHNGEADGVWSTAPQAVFPITAGQQYNFAGWIYADYMFGGAQAYLELEYFDSLDNVTGRSTSDLVVGSTGGWMQVKGSGMPPTGTVKGLLHARLEGQGFVRFDNVIVSDSTLVPFLAFDVDAYPDPVSSTGTLTYVINLTNTGGFSADSLRLTETLDSRTTLIHSDPIPGELKPGESISALRIVAVNVITNAQVPLSATFETDADGIEPKSLVQTTLISPNIAFELSPCEIGFGMRDVPLDYVHILTNTGNRPTSFDASLLLVYPPGCGMASVTPENTGPVPALANAPITLTLTPMVDPPDECLAVLRVRAPNNAEKLTSCETRVVSSLLGLEMTDNPNPVQAGQNLTYTVIYTYASSIDPGSLGITVTLGEPAVGTMFSPPPDITVSDRIYVWQPATGRSGGTGIVSVIAHIPPGSTGPITSAARMAARNTEPVNREVTTEIRRFEVYLPVILRSWPDILLPPELYPIDNADINGSYTLNWTEVGGATEYLLAESENDDCSNANQIYSGPDTSRFVSGKAEGRYCYCVQACSGSTCSEISNVECVDAWWEREPNNTCTDANGPLESGKQYYGRHDWGNWDCFWIDLQRSGQVSAALDTVQAQGLQLQLLDQNCDLVGPPGNQCYDTTEPYELGGAQCAASAGLNHVCIFTMQGSDEQDRYSLTVTLP